ncbi:hypothetical protein MAR_004391 [Mya arenaria]|uniref:Uncharacterized protein n=1 Tax=Mya arenaria TaxID=6604 RepID=A0ABY7F065_MYAAR|nr:hypothetical protein MAR_004391 [Mya arenaria]
MTIKQNFTATLRTITVIYPYCQTSPINHCYNNNQEEVRLATYFAQNPKGKQSSPKLKPFKFKSATTHLKTAFTRAYDHTYSAELFREHTRYHRGILPIYRLQDLQGDDIKGTFYDSELQKKHVDTDQTWKVEKVLTPRQRT